MVSYEQIVNCANVIRKAVGGAEIGLVLGSGLGEYVESLEGAKYISYKEIPNFPVSTAPGHAGRWWTCEIGGKTVCVMQGRFHAYEGYSLDEVTMPMRIMKLLGVKTLVLTNAAGGVNESFKPGTLMVLNDYINFSGKNPLTGPNLDEFGPRFPDMTYAYDPELVKLCLQQAEKMGMSDCVRQGVYMWFNGPCYETPAEVRFARTCGADAVGMSTVPETIVANHCGMKVLGMSCITNMAAGIMDQRLSHTEVMETAMKVKVKFRQLLEETIRAM